MHGLDRLAFQLGTTDAVLTMAFEPTLWIIIDRQCMSDMFILLALCMPTGFMPDMFYWLS